MVLVAAGHDKQGAASGHLADVLRVEVAPPDSGIAIDGDLMGAHHVLGVVQPTQRARDPADDLLDAVLAALAEIGYRVGSEHLPEGIPIAGVERPAVVDRQLDDGRTFLGASHGAYTNVHPPSTVRF